MKEIVNLSRWRRKIPSKYKDHPPVIEEIRLKVIVEKPRYMAMANPEYSERTEIGYTLKEAKSVCYNLKALTSWKHEYFCPECNNVLTYNPTDYGDFICERGHSYTIHGDKAKKHN